MAQSLKYGVINPKTGQYEYFPNQSEALHYFAKAALDFVLPHFHNTPFSLIQTTDEGKEIWVDISGKREEICKHAEKYVLGEARYMWDIQDYE